MLGPLGMLFFLFAVIGVERARSPVPTGGYETAPIS
jgi:hypothetical protein